MEQHPIPQNVSSYQFKLVGDMTLKQFFQLAGGFLVGLIFYSSPLIGIIKWPFAIVSVLLGAAMAFVPLAERPLEQWILAFFKAIYNPTMFYWKKTAVKQKFFQDEGVNTTVAPISQSQEDALKNYLSAGKQAGAPLVKLETQEKGFLSTLAGIFAGLKNQSGTDTNKTAASPVPTPEVKKVVEVPVNIPIKITPTNTPHLVVEEKARQAIPNFNVTTQQVSPIVAGNEMVSTKQAIFSIDAAPPNPPTTPNVVVGQVVDSERKIVEGAIMEIKDAVGHPIRALRSNKLGHFIIITPLDSGKYSLVTEKDGYQFTPISFEASGNLIPPILVEGKRMEAGQVFNNQQI